MAAKYNEVLATLCQVLPNTVTQLPGNMLYFTRREKEHMLLHIRVQCQFIESTEKVMSQRLREELAANLLPFKKDQIRRDELILCKQNALW